jgi:hypothetical protein
LKIRAVTVWLGSCNLLLRVKRDFAIVKFSQHVYDELLVELTYDTIVSVLDKNPEAVICYEIHARFGRHYEKCNNK